MIKIIIKEAKIVDLEEKKNKNLKLFFNMIKTLLTIQSREEIPFRVIHASEFGETTQPQVTLIAKEFHYGDAPWDESIDSLVDKDGNWIGTDKGDKRELIINLYKFREVYFLYIDKNGNEIAGPVVSIAQWKTTDELVEFVISMALRIFK